MLIAIIFANRERSTPKRTFHAEIWFPLKLGRADRWMLWRVRRAFASCGASLRAGACSCRDGGRDVPDQDYAVRA